MSKQPIKPIKVKGNIAGFGEVKEYTVDESTRKLICYNNKKKQAIYQAQEIENGELIPFFIDYIVEDTIDGIDERLKCSYSPVKSFYAKVVDYNASANDPERKVWSKIVDNVKNNPSYYFDKYGDWKNDVKLEKDRFGI